MSRLDEGRVRKERRKLVNIQRMPPDVFHWSLEQTFCSTQVFEFSLPSPLTTCTYLPSLVVQSITQCELWNWVWGMTVSTQCELGRRWKWASLLTWTQGLIPTRWFHRWVLLCKVGKARGVPETEVWEGNGGIPIREAGLREGQPRNQKWRRHWLQGSSSGRRAGHSSLSLSQRMMQGHYS